MLYASFINFDRINSFILWFIWDTEIIQLTGESGNVATHWNTVCPPTLFSQSLMKLFKMVLMYGLLLMVNPNISWHNSNIKRSASNMCYSTQQDQTNMMALLQRFIYQEWRELIRYMSKSFSVYCKIVFLSRLKLILSTYSVCRNICYLADGWCGTYIYNMESI